MADKAIPKPDLDRRPPQNESFGATKLTQQTPAPAVYRSGQVRPGQVRSGQVRSGQVRSGQVRSGQVRSSQVMWFRYIYLVRPSRRVRPVVLVFFCPSVRPVVSRRRRRRPVSVRPSRRRRQGSARGLYEAGFF